MIIFWLIIVTFHTFQSILMKAGGRGQKKGYILYAGGNAEKNE